MNLIIHQPFYNLIVVVLIYDSRDISSAYGSIWSSNMWRYWTRSPQASYWPTSPPENHRHTIMLSPPYFIIGRVQLGLHLQLFRRLTHSTSSDPYTFNLLSSDKNIRFFCRMPSVSYYWNDTEYFEVKAIFLEILVRLNFPDAHFYSFIFKRSCFFGSTWFRRAFYFLSAFIMTQRLRFSWLTIEIGFSSLLNFSIIFN